MHLTPRSLGLAAAAAFTGCTLFGVITSIDLVPSATAGTPSTAQATPDATTTEPSPRPTAATAPPLPKPTPTATTPFASPATAPTSVPVTQPTPSSTPTATPRTTPAAAAGTAAPAPRATARPKPRRTSTPTPGRSFSAPAPAPRPRPRATPTRTATTRGWAAPQLRVGANTITVPRLTSGAAVSVTVGCSPSAGCAMTGSTLTISDGTAVTVTWSAPARSGHTAWSVSRGL